MSGAPVEKMLTSHLVFFIKIFLCRHIFMLTGLMKLGPVNRSRTSHWFVLFVLVSLCSGFCLQDLSMKIKNLISEYFV